MNTNSSKHHQVMSAENIQNEPDVKKIKLEEIHQNLISSAESDRSSKSRGFLEFCKNQSAKRLDIRHLQTFTEFTTLGKIF